VSAQDVVKGFTTVESVITKLNTFGDTTNRMRILSDMEKCKKQDYTNQYGKGLVAFSVDDNNEILSYTWSFGQKTDRRNSNFLKRSCYGAARVYLLQIRSQDKLPDDDIFGDGSVLQPKTDDESQEEEWE
tara:strand:+ start:1065 stop:1454 length:390 start_codon:yes stop_codon:yes gene_type:complete